MIPALIILAALVAVGFILWFLNRLDERSGKAAPAQGRKVADPPAGNNDETGVCCGLHDVCERDSLLAPGVGTPEYFDDEELDRFAGRAAADYSPEETEEFREVLLTMLPEDIAPWTRSLQMRGINLPEAVRDEVLMFVAERRAGQ